MRKPYAKEKVWVYEQLMHSLALAYQMGNSQRISELLSLIEQWSYAHRVGNGTLSDRAQDNLIKQEFYRIMNHV